MISQNSFIQLFPCCKIVKGNQKDAIYDLQREEYHLIPHSLTKVLDDAKNLSWGQLVSKYKSNLNILNEYLDFLIRKELIIIDENISGVMDIDKGFISSATISNAILDFDRNTDYNIQLVISELDELRCENIEIRFYDEISVQSLLNILSLFENTGIRDIEVLIPYQDILDIDFILKLHLDFPRLRKVTIHKSPKQIESVNIHDEICIIYSSEEITNEDCCGVINHWYMLPKTELYLESQQFNTCLNRKVGIDRFGNIKNCPSASHSYGTVGKIKICDVVCRAEFQRYWKIKKDDIKGCKDCELRHMCQDCRIFIEDLSDIYSKPQKCKYNPIKS